MLGDVMPPNFFVIGAAKAATTSLHADLGELEQYLPCFPRGRLPVVDQADLRTDRQGSPRGPARSSAPPRPYAPEVERLRALTGKPFATWTT